jgi:hypothetical protein
MREGLKKIHYSNRFLYSLITLVMLAILSTGVYAISSSGANSGHPASDVDFSSGIQSNLAVYPTGANSYFYVEKNNGGDNYVQIGNFNPNTATTNGVGFSPLLLDANPLVLQARSGGSVGIGVVNPTEKLEVNGNIKVRGAITTTDSNGGYVSLGPNDGGIEIGSGNDGYSYIDFKGKDKLLTDFQGRIGYDDSGRIDFGILTGTKGMTLDSTGLEVNGNVKATKFIGDGSSLTGITASQITGLPPASSSPKLSNGIYTTNGVCDNGGTLTTSATCLSRHCVTGLGTVDPTYFFNCDVSCDTHSRNAKSCNNVLIGYLIAPCFPDTSCASSTCVGQTCADNNKCGGTIAGTKQSDCSAASSICTGTTFNSANSCTGTCTGTKSLTCNYGPWSSWGSCFFFSNANIRARSRDFVSGECGGTAITCTDTWQMEMC